MMSTGWLGVLQSCVSLRRLLLYCHDTTTALSGYAKTRLYFFKRIEHHNHGDDSDPLVPHLFVLYFRIVSLQQKCCVTSQQISGGFSLHPYPSARRIFGRPERLRPSCPVYASRRRSTGCIMSHGPIVSSFTMDIYPKAPCVHS